jgi:type IV secretory pathway VirB2 component (pilin)
MNLFKKYKKWMIGMAVLVMVLLPAFSQAALVPCGGEGNPCRLCHIYVLAQNIIDFLMWDIAPALAILVVAWGGFNILIAGGDPGKKQYGRKAITTAIVGLLIVFGSWVIINEFLLFFSGQSGNVARIFNNPWTDVKCQ